MSETSRGRIPLRLGPDVIQILLPHRRPFLMVDAVESYGRAPGPSLRASRHVSANEPVFEGHFPGFHLWPGAYTIEGLAQTCSLLFVVHRIEEAYRAEGGDPDVALEALRGIEAGYRLGSGALTASARQLVQRLGSPSGRLGYAAAVNVKLTHPVYAGQRLDYEVTRTHQLDPIMRYEVVASVDGAPVAKGTIHGAFGVPLPGALAP